MSDSVTVQKIADLAKIHVGINEEIQLEQDFKKILHFFDQVENVNTEGLEPLVTPTEIDFFVREDIAQKYEVAPEAFMEQAPERQGNLYKVPPVV